MRHNSIVYLVHTVLLVKLTIILRHHNIYCWTSAAVVRSRTMVRTELLVRFSVVRSTVQASARTGPYCGSWFWHWPNGSVLVRTLPELFRTPNHLLTTNYFRLHIYPATLIWTRPLHYICIHFVSFCYLSGVCTCLHPGFVCSGMVHCSFMQSHNYLQVESC